jgi:glutaredoxin-like YruB-family protein
MTKKRQSVKIYATPTCPYCNIAKAFLRENKVDFTDIDVSRDRAAAREMIEKSGQMGVPVLDIDGKLIVGFDRDAIKKALDIN